VHEPRWLNGPQFALLDAAYREAVRYQFSSQVRSLGIFMGGTDLGGSSAQVLVVCRELVGFTGLIEVVSTSANPHLSALRAVCARWPNTSLALDVPNLAGFFARHDLQIGAGGGSTWERCCMGVPTIGIAIASNQTVVISELEQLGAIRSARLPSSTDECCDPAPPLAQVLTDLLTDSGVRQRLGRSAASLVDGRGAQRVALALLGNVLQLRSAILEDAKRLYDWRNHPMIRAVSLQGRVIDWSSHVNWLRCTLSAPDRWLFVAHVGNVSVGSIRFDLVGHQLLAVSLYLDPSLQGLGLGSHMLLAGEQAMLSKLGGPFTVKATVMEGNASSLRMFMRCHYARGLGSSLHKQVSS
jgi:UDP-2,4-diacetamido-2,4,6-trideoxy-beta-L-altropyranose hydrolase